MTGLLIAIILGWAGGYRFYKKQYLLALIYLFTFGLCGIGWIVDIIKAFKEYSVYKQPKNFTCNVQGVFAECKRDKKVKRIDLLHKLHVGDPLTLEIDFYKDAPFYLVVAPSGLDLGALPSEMSKMILNNYPKAKLSATLKVINDDYPVIDLIVAP